jgi:hypothetical protein
MTRLFFPTQLREQLRAPTTTMHDNDILDDDKVDENVNDIADNEHEHIDVIDDNGEDPADDNNAQQGTPPTTSPRKMTQKTLRHNNVVGAYLKALMDDLFTCSSS